MITLTAARGGRVGNKRSHFRCWRLRTSLFGFPIYLILYSKSARIGEAEIKRVFRDQIKGIMGHFSKLLTEQHTVKPW